MHDLKLAMNTNMGSGSGIRLPYHQRWLGPAEIDVLLHTRRFGKEANALELGTPVCGVQRRCFESLTLQLQGVCIIVDRETRVCV